jgi:phosphoglycolate phosphatase
MKPPFPKLPVPRAILFDLDGTLADTAPDLAAALNHLQLQRGLAPTPFELLRPHASSGARGLIAAGLGKTPDDADYEDLKFEFLAQYESALAQHTRLFDEIPRLLQQLEAQGVLWGIVTNKAARFTLPLIPLIGLQQAACVVSGDTTPHAKPHPAPLLEAARQLQVSANECWYLGDDLRDIQAAHAAGMTSLAVAWGYCGSQAPLSWNAHGILNTPMDLLDWIARKN